ncbi:MAG: ABC transporter ATP-binding protein, partial [Alphaproteobacteria bacterium]|nr:ABC transporter ATP-binding protein [Alphaproteobacteria bacterium]
VIAGVKLRGIATLIVDRDVATLAGLCDRCVILAKGRVVYSAAAGDLAANPAIRADYLGI